MSARGKVLQVVSSGFSPKKLLRKNPSFNIPKIDSEFNRLAQKIITDREDAARTKGEERLANDSRFLVKLAKAVKIRVTALRTGTSARQKGFYLPPHHFPSTPPSVSPLGETKFITPPPTPPRVSPNSPPRGGYNSRKYKKPTVLAKKPKKVKKVKAKK